MSTRILIADDHPIFRAGMRQILASERDLEVIGEAADGLETLRLVQELQPDVLLLDLSMPNLAGMEVVRELAGSRVKIVILAADIPRDTMLTALRQGVRGVLLKETAPALLRKCLRCVAAGELWVGRKMVDDIVSAMASAKPPAPRYNLTARESQVLALIVAGNSNRQIAEQCNVSTDTVKHHVANIFDKTGASSRLELAMFAVHHRLV